MFNIGIAGQSTACVRSANSEPATRLTLRKDDNEMCVKWETKASRLEFAVTFSIKMNQNITSSSWPYSSINDCGMRLLSSSKYSLHASVEIMKPGGTGSPKRVISARSAPLLPSCESSSVDTDPFDN